MSYLIQTQFSKYNLTTKEEISGSILIADQKLFIQNQLGTIAEQLVALLPDPLNYTVFIQDHAFLKGQLSAFQYLLDMSIASEKIALEEAQNSN